MPHSITSMITQKNHPSLDIQKCFQQAFDRHSKHRKAMFRAVSHILSLAQTRGFSKTEKMRLDFQLSIPNPSQQEQWLKELFEFVSVDECTQLVQGFQSFSL